MFLIVGLGNPGRQYEHTRHNAGFDVMDALAEKYNISISESGHKALFGKGMIGGQKVILAKPQTFMNLSGESLRPIMDFYKLEPEDFIIIHDDIDLDVGRLRIRRKGSAGGHNGLKSIISHLGSMDFPRVKIGVGEKPKGYDLADIKNWSPEGYVQETIEGIKTESSTSIAQTETSSEITAETSESESDSQTEGVPAGLQSDFSLQ